MAAPIDALKVLQASGSQLAPDFSTAEELLARLRTLCRTKIREAAVSEEDLVEGPKWMEAWVTIKSWKAADPGILEAGKENGLQGIIDYLGLPGHATDVLGQFGESWKSEYADPGNVLDYICDTLDGYVGKWANESKYLTAWTAVIQSSGWGKSRTICELKRKGVYVIYLSFMANDKMGFPPGTPAAQTLSVKKELSERAFASWFVAFLDVLGDFITGHGSRSAVTVAEAWMTHQLVNSDQVRDDVMISQRKWLADMKSSGMGIMPGLKEWSDSSLGDWFQKKIAEFLSREGLGGLLRSSSELRILFCLDEAGSLFRSQSMAFLAFRRVFSIINFKSGIFGVVMDTTAHLGRLMPQKVIDPSLKGTKEETMVFPPLNLVGVCWLDTCRLQEGCLESPSLEATAELYKLGRPLWRAGLPATVTLHYFSKFRLFACQKLLGGLTLSQVQGDPRTSVSEAMAMALVGVAAGLEVAPWSNLAVEMVAGYMRTAVEITDEGDRIFSADAMEPILGEAAAVILSHKGTLAAVLRCAQVVCAKQALVVEGPRGELVGRLLLVLAMHRCYDDRSKGESASSYNVYSYPVPLEDFLTKLCGVKVKAKGLVCFNRFIVLNREATPADMLFCFQCGFAIMPPRGQEAYDVLIVYLVPGPDGTYRLQEDRMRSILVQIRNRDSYATSTKRLGQYVDCFCVENEVAGDTESRASDQVDIGFQGAGPSAPEEHYVTGPLGVYMHLRGPRTNLPAFEEAENGKVFVLHGMRPYEFLDPVIKSLLFNLLTAFHKLGEKEEGKSLKILRRIVPNFLAPEFEKVTSKAQAMSLSKRQLRDLCSEKGIKCGAKWNKAKMVRALIKARENEPCATCNLQQVEGSLAEKDWWIECDTCKRWFHCECVGKTGHEDGMDWACDTCCMTE